MAAARRCHQFSEGVLVKGFIDDIQTALWLMLRRPRFALLTILVLGIGIGASVAVFSLVDGVLLKPLPYPQADQLMTLGRDTGDGEPHLVSTHKFAHWREHARGFDSMAAYEGLASGFSVFAGDRAEHLPGARVSAGLLRTLGMAPALGREFTRNEERDAPRQAVISYALWLRMFAGHRDAIGRRIELDGVAHEVIGVMPREFDAPLQAQVWLPLKIGSGAGGDGQNLVVIGRLATNVTAKSVAGQLRLMAAQYRQAFPQAMAAQESIQMVPTLETVTGDVSAKLNLLAGAVLALLLIAVANVSSLGLARLNSRGSEFAVRDALGASRWQTIRMVLAETLTLSCVSALVGVGFAYAVVATLPHWVPSAALPRLANVELDLTAIVAAFVLALVVSILLGVLSIAGLGRMAQELRVRGGGTRANARTRAFLVGGQLALSTVLILASGLLVESLTRLSRTELGFAPAPLVAADLPLSKSTVGSLAGLTTYFDRVSESLRQHPDVEQVAFAGSLPLEPTLNLPVESKAGSEPVSVDVRMVTSSYFDTLTLPLRQGRDFDSSDRVGAEAVAIVNEAYVQANLGNSARALDSTLWLGRGGGAPWEEASARRIIGVAPDVHDNGPEQAPPPTVYIPLAQFNEAAFWEVSRFFAPTVLIRTRGEPQALLLRLEDMIQQVDPRQAVARPRALAAVHADYLAQPKFLSLLLGGFAILSLMLAAVGLYALVNFIAQSQHREIGLRMALGSSPRQILHRVLTQSLWISVPGLLLGLLLLWPASRWLGSLIPDLPTPSPLMVSTAMVALLLASLLASIIPARRAARVDPSTVLRHE